MPSNSYMVQKYIESTLSDFEMYLSHSFMDQLVNKEFITNEML